MALWVPVHLLITSTISVCFYWCTRVRVLLDVDLMADCKNLLLICDSSILQCQRFFTTVSANVYNFLQINVPILRSAFVLDSKRKWYSYKYRCCLSTFKQVQSIDRCLRFGVVCKITRPHPISIRRHHHWIRGWRGLMNWSRVHGESRFFAVSLCMASFSFLDGLLEHRLEIVLLKNSSKYP